MKAASKPIGEERKMLAAVRRVQAQARFTDLAGDARVIVGALRLLQVGVAPTGRGPSDAIDWNLVEQMLSELAVKMRGIGGALDSLADVEAEGPQQ